MRLATAARITSQRVMQELRESLYLRTGGRADLTRPQVISAILTLRCNYRCLSCGCWRKPDAEELTLDQWTRALADLREFLGGRFTVRFSGGEPFVFKPFLPLIEWCRDAGVDFSLITNGSALSPKNAARLAAAGPLCVGISVDGATAAVHDASRGIKGSLDTIARGIETLRAARDAAKRHFPIRIKPTVHRGNFREMPALVRWAKNTGATSVDFSPVRHWTSDVITHLWIERHDESALKAVCDELIAMKRSGEPIETEESRLDAWPAHFRGEETLPSLRPCRVGLRDYFILPNGDVRSCWFYPVMGNVKNATAKEIWRSAAAGEQRAKMTDCPSFGSVKCASSCLSHRTLRQDAGRALMLYLPSIRGRSILSPPRTSTASGEEIEATAVGA